MSLDYSSHIPAGPQIPNSGVAYTTNPEPCGCQLGNPDAAEALATIAAGRGPPLGAGLKRVSGVGFRVSVANGHGDFFAQYVKTPIELSSRV